MTAIQNRLRSIDRFAWPGLEQVLTDNVAPLTRWFREHCYDPCEVIALGADGLERAWQEQAPDSTGLEMDNPSEWAKMLVQLAQEVLALYGTEADTRRVSNVWLGAFSSIPSTSRGSLYFDGFESRYTQYIGLDPTALTPPAPPAKTDALFSDNFESGGTSNWAVVTTTGGDLSVSTQAAVTGTYGLKVLQDDTTADYLTDYRPWDETQYRARFYLKTNGIYLAENTPLYIFYALNRDGVVVARIALQNSNGDYQIKAEAVNDAGAFTTASTSWMNIYEGLHAIEINWQAATSLGANNGVLTLWIDGTQKATYTTIDNDTDRVDQAQLGAISGMNASHNGTLYMDLFESRRSTYIGLDGSAPAPQTTAPDLIYANGFESGNFTGWSSSSGGNLSVTTAAHVGGTYGMQAIAANNASISVVDKRPSNESQYRARFYFKPNSILIGDATFHYLLYAQQGTSSPTTIMQLALRKNLGEYEIMLSALDDTGTWRNTAWYNVANQLYYFEVNWQAATAAGANNGVLTLWLDGTQKETITNLDNDTRRVDQIQFGQMGVPASGTSGTEYFDLYEAHRTSYIGPDAGVTTPTPPTPPLAADAIFSDGFESGNMSAWSANTPNGTNLSVTTAAKIVGNYGLSALINNNNPEFVTDFTPWLEPHYRMQFQFKPNGITMATNDAHYIFYALNYSGVIVARVEFGKNASSYQIRAGAIDDGTTYTDLGWTNVTNASHKIEIEWKAATAPGANNGVLTLWIDTVQKASVTTLDNDTRRVDWAQLGAISGVDTGTRGTEYFDAFVSRRTTAIGLAAPQNGIQVANSPVWPEPSFIPVVYHPQYPLAIVGDSFPVLKPMGGRLADVPVSRAITYTYDPLNRLKSANYGDGNTFSYTYDAVGNRLSQTTQNGTTVSTYDDANRLATVGGVTYTWDANGNLLSDGVSTYTYDHANRLISVTQSGTTYQYAYNGTNDRITQVVGGTTTRYTLDMADGLTQVLADGTDTYLYGNERIGQYQGMTPGYFLGDALGSVRQLTNGTGAITLTRQYDPFGNVLNSTGTGVTIYGYDGEQTDSYIKLMYLRSRYMSTDTGRFITRDTWQGSNKSPMSYNGWIFVRDNPINMGDPSGFCYDVDQNSGKIVNYLLKLPINGPCPGSELEPSHSNPIVPNLPNQKQTSTCKKEDWRYWLLIKYEQFAKITITQQGEAGLEKQGGEVPIIIPVLDIPGVLGGESTQVIVQDKTGGRIENVIAIHGGAGLPGNSIGLEVTIYSQSGVTGGLYGNLGKDCKVDVYVGSNNGASISCGKWEGEATLDRTYKGRHIMTSQASVDRAGGVHAFGKAYILVPPQSTVYNSMIEVNGKMVGFDSTRRRKSPLNEGFNGNPGDSYSVF